MSTQYFGADSPNGYFLLSSPYHFELSASHLLFSPQMSSTSSMIRLADDITLYFIEKMGAFRRKTAHLPAAKSTDLPAFVSTQTTFSLVKMEGFLSKTGAFMHALDLITWYLF